MTIHRDTPDTAPGRPTEHVAGPHPGRVALWAAGAATLAALLGNLIIWGALAAGGAELAVTRGGSATEIGVLAVVATTLLPMLLGAGVLALGARRTPRAWPVLAWVGAAVAVASLAMPLLADASTGTRLGLAGMHLLAGAAWFAALTRLDPARAARPRR